MASAEQTVNNIGGGSSGASGNLVGWRDANNSIGSLFGDSGRSSASSGNISTGDRILGGTSQKSLKFGLVKFLCALTALVIIVKIWKGGKK